MTLVVGTAGRDRDRTVTVSQLRSVMRANLAESVGLLDARTVRRLGDELRLVRRWG